MHTSYSWGIQWHWHNQTTSLSPTNISKLFQYEIVVHQHAKLRLVFWLIWIIDVSVHFCLQNEICFTSKWILGQALPRRNPTGQQEWKERRWKYHRKYIDVECESKCSIGFCFVATWSKHVISLLLRLKFLHHKSNADQKLPTTNNRPDPWACIKPITNYEQASFLLYGRLE